MADQAATTVCPVIVGVAGGSGSGKTTVASRINRSIGSDHVTVVQHDSYYRDRSELPTRERSGLNYDHPDAHETSLLVSHLHQLKNGQPVDIPVYDFSNHVRKKETITAFPRLVVVVEGILILADGALRDLMDIKVLVNRDRDLEQWQPRMKGEFPLPSHVIKDEVFPAFGVALPDLNRDSYSFEQYLDDIIRPQPDLAAVSVYKQRFGFEIDGCTAELANVYINGALMRTTCLESTDPGLVLETRARLHLDHYENVNYLLAIKRVIGMAPLPDGVFYRAC